MTGRDDESDEDVPLSDLARRVEGGIEEGGPNKWTIPGGETGDSEGSRHRPDDSPAGPRDSLDEPDDDGSDGDVPLADLARRVERRRSDDAARADEGSLFESMTVEEVEGEDLWAGLVESDADGPTVGASGLAESVADDLPGYEDYVVPKAEFCQQCPHFADPPELACTHEGTEIVEVVETDRFRVRNCPMVDED